MKTIFLLLIGILGGAALGLNPSLEVHEDAITEKFKNENTLLGLVGGGSVMSSLVEYENYYLFSMTTLNEKRISVGAYNKVMVIGLNVSTMAEDAVIDLRDSIKTQLKELQE